MKPQGAPSKLGIVFKFLFCALIAALLALIAWGLLYGGFSSLRDLRQLDRTPRSLAAAVLPGEVTLDGRARVDSGTLRGPNSGVETLYFDYQVEREERDSDNKTRWVTIEHRTEYLPFLLADESGTIRIEPSARTRFDAATRHTSRVGNLRYTEQRIDPGDPVFVFGLAQDIGAGVLGVRFETEGQYSPLISTSGEAAAHSGMTGATLVMIWFGLCFVSFAIFALLWGLRVHLSTAYLATLSLAMMVSLLLLSLQAAHDDLEASFARTVRDVAAAEEAISARLRAHGVEWDGDWSSLGEPAMTGFTRLDAEQQRLLGHLRDRLALQVERTAAVRRQWPERVVAATMALPELPALPMRAGEVAPTPEDETGAVLAWILASMMFAAATLFAWLGFRRIRLKRMIENLATTRTAGVAYGLVELKATAAVEEGSEPLVGPLSERPCVWYHYVVKERRGSGKNRRWVTIEDRRVDQRFCLVDGEGRLAVDPTDAEAIVSCSTTRTAGGMRYSERWIETGTEVYALGSALVDPKTERSLLLCRGPKAQPFLLSDLGESALLLKKARSAFLMLNFGANAGNAAALSLLGATAALDGAGFLFAGLVPLGFFALFLAIVMYNDLVTLRQRVRLTWANIEVSLTKRADLVPQLEAVLKAYLAHEAGLQADLTRMRALASQGGLDTAAAGQLVGAEQHVLSRLVVLREQYPALAASELAMQLSATLVRLDDEVALMREGYNNAVERYNSRCQQVPELLFAKAFRFAPAASFQADMAVHAAPLPRIEDAQQPA